MNEANTTTAALNTKHIVTATRGSNLTMATTNIGDYFQVGTNAARSFQGDVAEVIVYDRVLTAREVHQVNGALGLKYDIASSPASPSPAPSAATDRSGK